MRHKFLRSFLVVALLASNAFAQQPARTINSAPDAERLRAHVTYLASDKLDGRRTGTVGAEAAAQYIAEEFKRLGLRPVVRQSNAPSQGKEGKSGATFSAYAQAFPYVADVELGEGNAMSFSLRASDTAAGAKPASLDLRLREDWMPLGFSGNGRVDKAPVVFVGYGIKAGELNHDDYAGGDVTNRVAAAFAGTPDGDNPHGKFALYGDLRLKAAAARGAGAKAFVIIATEDIFKEDKLARLAYDNAGGDAGLPVIVVSRQFAAQASGRSLTELREFEKEMRAGAAAPRFTPDATLSIAVNVMRVERPAHNVVGILEGSDPQLKNEAIIIGAHYDHLGRGGQGSLAARAGEIHHGADDNASGTAALLELARLFVEERGKLRRSVIFIAFGGEEEGLLGSNFYVNNPAMPLAQTVAMVNMDMIGRLKEDRLLIGGTGTAPEWKAWIARANADPDIRMVVAMNGAEGKTANANGSGVEVPAVVGANGQMMATTSLRGRFALTLNEDGFGPSDHSSFYAKKIPVLFFFTGTHEDYHKPSDTAEKINYEGTTRVVSFVREIVRDVQASERRPTYALARSQSAGRATGFRVYLGTVPNYAETTDGMKLDAVRDDSPAAKAGLRAGDVIVKLAGRDVRNVYDYTSALAEMKAGEEYNVDVMRDGQRLMMKLTPAARK